MKLHSTALIAYVAYGTMLGCSGAGATSASDAGASGDSSAATDAGASGDSSAATDAMDAGHVPGFVNVELWTSMGVASVIGWYESLEASRPPLGSCALWHPQAYDAAAPAQPSLGDISVDGPSAGFRFRYNGARYATFDQSPDAGPLYAPGDTLTFAAPGRDLGPFGPLTLPIPNGKLNVTTPPPCTGNPCGTFARLTDNHVEWTPTAASALYVSVGNQGYTGSPPPPVVVCRFDPMAGSGILPSSLMQHVSAGWISVEFILFASVDSVDDTWPVHVDALLDADYRGMSLAH